MDFYIVNLSPYATPEHQCKWWSENGSGDDFDSLLDSLKTAVASGPVALGTFTRDDSFGEHERNPMARGMRLVARGGLLLGELLQKLHEVVPALEVGFSPREARENTLILWEVEHSLDRLANSDRDIDNDLAKWAPKAISAAQDAFNQVTNAQGEQAWLNNEFSPICIGPAALFRANMSERVPVSEGVLTVSV